MESATPSAPPDNPTYPLLWEMMAKHDTMGDGVVPEAEASPTPRAFEFRARNAVCPFCNEDMTSEITKPVAMLQCGHGYHASCGRSLLCGIEGRECTVGECHLTDDKIEMNKLDRIVQGIVARGEYKMSDLKDEVLKRDFLARVDQLMRQTASTSGQATALAPARPDSERSVDAYRARWKKTRVGREGFDFKTKAKLLFPYTKNPFEIKKATVTLGLLYQKEDEIRFAAQPDDQPSSSSDSDGEARIAVKVQKPAAAATAAQDAGDIKKRISVKRFIEAGLSIEDIFFGLELQSWQGLVDLGLKRTHISNSAGDFSVTALSDLYSVDYSSYMGDIGWTLRDIHSAKLKAKELSNIGLSFPKLWARMGMQKADFLRFGYSAKEWAKTLGTDKRYIFRPLEISSTDLKMLRWTPQEFAKAFDVHEIEMLRITSDVDASAGAGSSKRRTTIRGLIYSSTSSDCATSSESSSSEKSSSDDDRRGRTHTRARTRKRRTSRPKSEGRSKTKTKTKGKAKGKGKRSGTRGEREITVLTLDGL